MTQNFRNLLLLLGNSVNNCNNILKDCDIEGIQKLAVSQGVWTLVFPELKKHCDAEKYIKEFSAIILKNMVKNNYSMQAISELERAGFSCVTLKGNAISSLYPKPEYRISSDTDILINPDDEAGITMALEKMGYTVKPRKKNDHHFKAYHSVGGLLEGHISLFSENTRKFILDGISLRNEPDMRINFDGHDILTLGVNDGLMYLTAHYIKHLINGGGGIRQMLDLLIYTEHYKDKIDFEKYGQKLKQLRYNKLIDVVKTIGAMYWGFDYDIKYPELAEKLLTDSEEGGIFGHNTKSRHGFYDDYCRLRKSSISYGIAKTFKAERNLFNRLFPSGEFLVSNGFKYARNKVLIPFAWASNLFAAASRRLTKNNAALSAVQNRIDMMRELEMLN